MPTDGLHCKCPRFKCPLCEGQPNCCCHRILFKQLDFMLQRPQLQEFIKLCGHICDFYLKYHCELNFIKQYWGAAKLCYRIAGHARTLNAMEKKMLECLDDIPLKQIRRYVSYSLFFSFLFRTKMSL